MEMTEDFGEDNFKNILSQIMDELQRRKLKKLFYQEFGLSPSLISQWKSGKKFPTQAQSKSFLEIAVRLISDHKTKSQEFERERLTLVREFRNLISA